MLPVILDDRPQVQGIERGQNFPGKLVYLIFLPALVRVRGFERGLEPAEAHDVHQFMGQDIAQQWEKFQVVPGGQRLQDVMVLEAHPVEIEGRGFKLPPRLAAAVFGHHGQGVGRNFLDAQVGQGGDVIPGGQPMAAGELEKVRGHLLGYYQRLSQGFLVLCPEVLKVHKFNI